MKKNVFCKCIAAAIAAALLLCGCQSGNDGSIDIDIAPDPDITTENNERAELPDMRVLTPFIMPQEGTEEYLYYSSKMEAAQVKGSCVPGYLYLKNAAEDLFFLLEPYEFDEADGLYQYEREVQGYTNWRYVYGAAKLPDGEKLLKVDKITGSYAVVYTPAGGKVELMTPSERHGDNSGRIFFKDGKRLCALDPSSDQVTVCAESESGITDIKCEAFIYERINTGGVEDAYTCEKCGSEYFAIWADGEGQYYWYHVHSGESEPIDFQYLYYPFYCFNDLIFRGSKTDDASPYSWRYWGEWGEWELYSRDKETRENTLLVDNVIYHYNHLTYHSSLFIARQDGVNRLMTIDERTGVYETIYDFQDDDIQIIYTSGDVDENDRYITNIFFREGDSIIKLNSDSLEVNVMYASQYGKLEVIDRYFAGYAWLLRDGNTIVKATADTFESKELFDLENGLTQVYFPSFAEGELVGMMTMYPDEDISDFYICQECSMKEDYIIWADNDTNWFWHHPHTGENEPINIDTESYTGISNIGVEYQISYITRRD